MKEIFIDVRNNQPLELPREHAIGSPDVVKYYNENEIIYLRRKYCQVRRYLILKIKFSVGYKNTVNAIITVIPI